MNLERLSSNLIDIINEISKNQELVNLIGHNGNFPITSPFTPVKFADIAPYGKNQKIFPYPFNTKIKEDEVSVKTQLHIYYPNFTFENNNNVTQVIVIFDIVVHKNIWLMLDNGKKVVRPYQIVNQLYKTFNKKTIGGLGKIHFIDGSHVIINNEFEGIRLVASFTEF